MLLVSLNLRKSYASFNSFLTSMDKVRRSSSPLYILINTRIYRDNRNKVYKHD